MAGMNKVILIGRLGSDPKLSYTQSGQSVANFSLATDEGYKDKQTGKRVDKTEWHKITAWGPQADFCGNYLGKGRLVLIEGRLQTRKWQAQDGSDRWTTEVVASRVQSLDRAPTDDNHLPNQGQGCPPQNDPGPAYPSGNDDVPF